MPIPAGVEVRRVGALVGWGWELSKGGGRGGGAWEDVGGKKGMGCVVYHSVNKADVIK